MNSTLQKIKEQVYDKCNLTISEYKNEIESQEYDACTFNLNGKNIVSRTAKITPKKAGQFVTFWKRKKNGPITPFEETDDIDFFVVQVKTANNFGQFVFPKKILVKKGIISTKNKEGKRAFRVYPKWDITKNKQAEKTQKWQLEYFYEIEEDIDTNKVINLYKN